PPSPAIFREPQELVGRNPKNLADLVDQGETGLYFRAFVAGVAILFDPQRLGKIARTLKAALNPHILEALCELQSHLGCTSLSHAACSFADPAQIVIVIQCRFARVIFSSVGI